MKAQVWNIYTHIYMPYAGDVGRLFLTIDKITKTNISWNRFVPLVVNTFRSFPYSWLITSFVTRVTRRVSLVEQELLALLEPLSSHPVFNGVRITRSLVLCGMFCRPLFVLLLFFSWPLCCLSFFDLWILITPLVSSNSIQRNWQHRSHKTKKNKVSK